MLKLILQLLLVRVGKRVIDSLFINDLRVVFLVKYLSLNLLLSILCLILSIISTLLSFNLVLVLPHLIYSLLLLMLSSIVVNSLLKCGLNRLVLLGNAPLCVQSLHWWLTSGCISDASGRSPLLSKLSLIWVFSFRMRDVVAFKWIQIHKGIFRLRATSLPLLLLRRCWNSNRYSAFSKLSHSTTTILLLPRYILPRSLKRRLLNAFFLNWTPFLLPTYLILNSFSVPFSLLLLLHIDLLSLLLKVWAMFWQLLCLYSLTSAWSIRWRHIMNSIQAAVETAFFVANHLLLCWLVLSVWLLVAHSVLEVTVTTFDAISISFDLLSRWWPCIWHRNIWSTGTWISSWWVFGRNFIASVGKATMWLRSLCPRQMIWSSCWIKHIQLLSWRAVKRCPRNNSCTRRINWRLNWILRIVSILWRNIRINRLLLLMVNLLLMLLVLFLWIPSFFLLTAHLYRIHLRNKISVSIHKLCLLVSIWHTILYSSRRLLLHVDHIVVRHTMRPLNIIFDLPESSIKRILSISLKIFIHFDLGWVGHFKYPTWVLLHH